MATGRHRQDMATTASIDLTSIDLTSIDLTLPLYNSFIIRGASTHRNILPLELIFFLAVGLFFLGCHFQVSINRGPLHIEISYHWNSYSSSLSVSSSLAATFKSALTAVFLFSLGNSKKDKLWQSESLS